MWHYPSGIGEREKKNLGMYPSRGERRTPSWVALFVPALTVLLVAGCSGGGGGGQEEEQASQETATEETTGGMAGMEQGAKKMQGMTMEMETVDPSAAGVRVDFSSDPTDLQPNQPVALRYQVTDNSSGQVLTNLPIEMEKPMHLIAVSQDLRQFQHIHPAVSNDEAYTVSTTFPETATYVLFDEFMYNEQTVLDRREVNVGQALEKSASLSPDLDPKTEGGLTASLSAPEMIMAGEDEHFTLQVTRDSHPVTDLEPYLGVPAHLIILSSDTRNYAHTHGEVGGMESMGSAPSTFGPEISFHHNFPHAGLYKVWAQFGYQGDVITVPYVVEVQ